MNINMQGSVEEEKSSWVDCFMVLATIDDHPVSF